MDGHSRTFYGPEDHQINKNRKNKADDEHRTAAGQSAGGHILRRFCLRCGNDAAAKTDKTSFASNFRSNSFSMRGIITSNSEMKKDF